MSEIDAIQLIIAMDECPVDVRQSLQFLSERLRDIVRFAETGLFMENHVQFHQEVGPVMVDQDGVQTGDPWIVGNSNTQDSADELLLGRFAAQQRDLAGCSVEPGDCDVAAKLASVS